MFVRLLLAIVSSRLGPCQWGRRFIVFLIEIHVPSPVLPTIGPLPPEDLFYEAQIMLLTIRIPFKICSLKF